MNIEAQDLIEVLQQQRNNAMQQAALQEALVRGLQKQIAELETKLAEKVKGEG